MGPVAGRKPFAIAHASLASTRVFDIGRGVFVLVHRGTGESLFGSIHAFQSRAGFLGDQGRWVELESGAAFDPESGRFPGVTPLEGLDTFWYIWSSTHGDTPVLE